MFNPSRLVLAKKRRKMTSKALAEAAGVSYVTISRIEKGYSQAEDDTVKKLSDALKYPLRFFYSEDAEELPTSAVSFRSLRKMTAKERDASIAAGSYGIELMRWVEQRFKLPNVDLLDLSYESSPESAAEALRQQWVLGLKPIGNLIHLLEAKGVRVLSLSESSVSVDAYSFWVGRTPYIFLNSVKSAERSIFDTAHELGHLVMHVHGGAFESEVAEREANAFASAFLMPREDVRSRVPFGASVDLIIRAKKRWRVSAMAMAHRLHDVGRLTDWQYKSACIELGRRGYRSSEPDGIEREESAVWHSVLGSLWADKITKADIANSLSLPLGEVEGLIGGLTGSFKSINTDRRSPLRLV